MLPVDLSSPWMRFFVFGTSVPQDASIHLKSRQRSTFIVHINSNLQRRKRAFVLLLDEAQTSAEEAPLAVSEEARAGPEAARAIAADALTSRQHWKQRACASGMPSLHFLAALSDFRHRYIYIYIYTQAHPWCTASDAGVQFIQWLRRASHLDEDAALVRGDAFGAAQRQQSLQTKGRMEHTIR